MYRPTFVPPKPNAKGKGNLYYFFVVKMPFAERAAELNVCTAPVTFSASAKQVLLSLTSCLTRSPCGVWMNHTISPSPLKKKSGPVRMSIVILETDTSCRI